MRVSHSTFLILSFHFRFKLCGDVFGDYEVCGVQVKFINFFALLLPTRCVVAMFLIYLDLGKSLY